MAGFNHGLKKFENMNIAVLLDGLEKKLVVSDWSCKRAGERVKEYKTKNNAV
jgi:hypothetical protein